MDKNQAKELAYKAVSFLIEKKAHDVRLFDVEHISGVYDFAIVASGDSTVYLRSIARHLENMLREFDVKKLNSLKGSDNPWLLIDFGFMVVHLFLQITREYYNIESIWDKAFVLDDMFIDDMFIDDKKEDLSKDKV